MLRWIRGSQETFVDLAVVFASGLLGGYAAKQLSLWPGGGPYGVVAAVAAAWILMTLRGRDWTEVGMARPKSWPFTILLGFAGWFGTSLIIGLFILPILESIAAPPNLQAFDAIRGNLGIFLMLLLPVGWGTAAFGEEMLFRGLLMNRLAELMGRSSFAWGAALVLQAVIFGSMHMYQGLPGALLTGSVGFVIGAWYLLTGRNLWIVILVHGLIDTVSLTVVYLNADQAFR